MPVTDVEPKVRAHGTVHVKLPAKIAYDPNALKKSIGSLLERLGCTRCFSGANCFFTHERDFIVDAKGALAADPQPEPWVLGPLPDPWRSAGSVTVSLARGPRYNIDKVYKAVDKVIDIIGSCPCHSGIDVLYINELPVIGVNEQLEAQQFGG